ncbi:hypothetical protein [Azospirillum endophyticum]
MSILLRALARHLPACLLFAFLVLLGTGQIDPKPIAQVLEAAVPMVARRWHARIRSDRGAAMLWLPPHAPTIGDRHASSPL